jgi:hypothetical protein
MNSRLLSFPNSFAVIFGRRFLISRFFNHFFRSLAAPPSTFRAFAAGVATLLAVPSRLPCPRAAASMVMRNAAAAAAAAAAAVNA